jgi:putative FmdB family regulatory protein
LFVPLYEYLCSKCGHRFERIENHNASEKKKCPKCGAKARRVLAPSAIQFKGSGWYVTDYAGRSGGGESKMPDTAATETAKSPAKETPAAKETKAAKKDKS